MDKIDFILTLIDMAICIIDLSMMAYLFIYRSKKNKKKFQSRLDKRRVKVILAR